MSTYYVDPDASGADDGSSWTDAWQTLQQGADNAVAGDTVYCRGTEIISARIDFDTNAGTNANGHINFIGCNASGNVDGTRYIIDCNDNSINGIYFTGSCDMVWFENIEVKNNAGSNPLWNVSAYTTDGCVLINCCANNGTHNGFTFGSNFSYSLVHRCVAYLNAGDGFSIGSAASKLTFCTSRDNSGSGYSMSSGIAGGVTLYGCMACNNADDGLEATGYGTLLINCVLDGNGDNGVTVSAQTALATGPILLGCRITNHSGAGDIGIEASSDMIITGWNYFEDNDGDNIQNTLRHRFLPVENGSTTTNVEDQADADEGYVDRAGDNFATRYVDGTDPSLRRTAITLPWS